jgi:hypothetical protein
MRSTVQAFPSSQLLGHEEGGSHVSPVSTTPFPQLGEQSLSLLALHPGAQQPSPDLHSVMGEKLHAAEQLAALPVSESMVQALSSLQLVGHVEGRSQVSPVSTTPFPQLGEQSLSLLALHPGAQHPSPDLHSVMGEKLHAAEQLAALPVRRSMVQALPSLQLVGHVDGRSQVSPVSTTPFPQLGEQSLSLLALHPGAQHPSPDLHSVMGEKLHAAEQLAALPVKWSMVQALPSLQLVGHVDGKSQVSPTSTTPFPQLGEQSLSLLALHPGAQHPSPDLHSVMGEKLHAAEQLVALPVSESMVQALPSLQLVGHVEGKSQVSPVSTTPFPQLGEQSLSLLALHPGAQPPGSNRDCRARHLAARAQMRSVDGAPVVGHCPRSHEPPRLTETPAPLPSGMGDLCPRHRRAPLEWGRGQKRRDGRAHAPSALPPVPRHAPCDRRGKSALHRHARL